MNLANVTKVYKARSPPSLQPLQDPTVLSVEIPTSKMKTFCILVCLMAVVIAQRPPPGGSMPPPGGSMPPPGGSMPPPGGSMPPPGGSMPPPGGSMPPPPGTERPAPGSRPPVPGSRPPPQGTERPLPGSRPPPQGTERQPEFTRPFGGSGPPPTRPPFQRTERPSVGSRPPPRIDPRDNPESTCSTPRVQNCPQGQICLGSRRNSTTTINLCEQRPMQGQQCMERQFVQPQQQRRDEVIDDSGPTKTERFSREKAEGARDRDTARTINGAVQRTPCAENLRCTNENTCMPRPDNTRCSMARQRDSTIRCDQDGMFEPRQCRRPDGEMNSQQRPSALTCGCVNRMTGEPIRETSRQVTNRSTVPDCTPRSFQGCMTMRNGRMTLVRHQDSVLMRQDNQCRRCECNDGNFQCTPPDREDTSCDRADSQTGRPCMMDGRMVMNGEQREDGICNRCGCRDGELQCTRLPSCRRNDDDDDDGGDEDRMRRMKEDQECSACMREQRSPVCSVRDGRTFPTRCHAMRCQKIPANQLENRTCADRDSCSRDTSCGQSFSCMPLGGNTQMSRADDRPETRRLCVNRTEMRCAPTMTRADGSRILVDYRDSEDRDPLEELDNKDRTVCASDRNSYPSTCHMITESRNNTIPRVNRPGRCRDDDGTNQTRMVCGSDGVTYDDEDTMRTRGGNIRRDYMGPCMHPERREDNTTERICQMVRANQRCPNMTNCERRVQPSDGCCPACGSIVMLAIDQKAMDEHVRGTDRFHDLDDFSANLFRPGSDRVPPMIPENATKRCEVSLTRPTNITGNVTEVLFKARDMKRDAEHCHKQAMMMMMRVNNQEGTATIEQSLVAASAIAPELNEGASAAPALTASLVMVALIGSMLMAILF